MRRRLDCHASAAVTGVDVQHAGRIAQGFVRAYAYLPCKRSVRQSRSCMVFSQTIIPV
jgi:hypothetical protein